VGAQQGALGALQQDRTRLLRQNWQTPLVNHDLTTKRVGLEQIIRWRESPGNAVQSGFIETGHTWISKASGVVPRSKPSPLIGGGFFDPNSVVGISAHVGSSYFW